MGTVECRFCGRTGEEAIEDIIPKWLAKRLRASPTDQWHPGSLVVDHDGRHEKQHGMKQTAAAWKLDRVCAACNNVWMSDIEDDARRKILRMVRGEPIELSSVNRIEVTRWAQLKWICADALGGDPHLTSEVAHEFADATRPLPYCAVACGSYTARRDEPIPDIIWGRKTFKMVKRSQNAPVGGEVLGVAVQVVFRFGRLVIQVIGRSEPGPAVSQGAALTPGLLPCWPRSTDNARWDTTRPVHPLWLRDMIFQRGLRGF